MRVLVLTNLYPPNAMGGYELSCRDVVDRWRARGHDVQVLTTSTRIGGVVEPDLPQPHVTRTLEWYWHDHAFVRPPVVARWGIERRNLRRLRTALRSLQPDVVSVWHMGGMSLSLLTAAVAAGVPVVLNVCDDWTDYARRADAWLDGWSRRASWQRRLAAAALRLPTTVPDLDSCAATFVSTFTLERARQRTGFAFRDAHVVGSGVDPADFPIAAADDSRRPWRWRLLCVGRVEPRKGFDTAVRALARLPQATLDVVGVADPAYGDELQHLADELAVAGRVRMRALPRSSLREVYADADAFVFPSRWDEPFGLVPIEAMTQRTPVVATRRGGSAEFLVDGANCLEFDADDDEQLARAVRRVADDPALRRRLVDGGVATARRFTVDALADTLETVHRQAAGA